MSTDIPMDTTEAYELAHDCVTMTLHGPLPLATSMRLAEHVLALAPEVTRLRERIEALEGGCDENGDEDESIDEVCINSPYTKIVTYEFCTSQYTWRIVEVDDDGRMTFEAISIRRNVCGTVVLDANDWWVLTDAMRKSIEEVCLPGTADEVEAFFNEHGPPKG